MMLLMNFWWNQSAFTSLSLSPARKEEAGITRDWSFTEQV